MANEDIIKTWVQDKLRLTTPGYSIEKKNLAKESPETVFPSLYKAMLHASKSQNGARGTADFSYIVHDDEENRDYLIIIETKNNKSALINIQNENLLMDIKSTRNYATNGAVWYAKQIQKESRDFPRIFALGIAGDYDNQEVLPYFVNDTGGTIELPQTSAFTEFSPHNIHEYYRVNVEHQTPKSELNAETLSKYSSQLHNDIRNLVALKNEQKAPLIAAILLGIHSKNLSLDMLRGATTQSNNDGWEIYNAVQGYLEQRRNSEPDFDASKIDVILNTFNFLTTNKALYTPLSEIGNHSPLYKFTSELFEVYNTVKIGDDADTLGDFYSEFVKYNNSDGNVLGIVLTPKHITGLMADLLQIGKENYLLDPTTGSASFLVSGMNRMIKQIPKDENYKKNFNKVVSSHLYGVEYEPSIYSVAASNMILRGDGKSNITYGNFFNYKLKRDKKINDPRNTIYGLAPKVDRVLMNPPYSQGKDKAEIYFIKHALELLENGGKLSVIVPISVFVSGGKGVKAGPFKEFKKWLLNDYVVEDIITMNPVTFYPTATQTVIAVIRKNAGIGQGNRKTKLINFSDDGYTVVPKKGLIPNGTNVDKQKKLIDVVVNDEDAPDNFMLKVQLTADNEWVHNAHYTNPNHPTDADFLNAIADYVVFKQNMILHGRGDLFDGKNK